MSVPAPAIERRLRAAGRPVAHCPECGRAFDPSIDYSGHKGAPPRATCSTTCRRERRNRLATRLREHRHRTATLRAMHETEAAGQIPIVDEPLPELPDPPAADE